eukprot:9079290-Alexandrium_andersonii.AAC.1
MDVPPRLAARSHIRRSGAHRLPCACRLCSVSSRTAQLTAKHHASVRTKSSGLRGCQTAKISEQKCSAG